MLDLGANIETEFSPIKFTKAMWKLSALDYLMISHPHVDHIRDITNLDKLPPKVFRRRSIEERKLIPADVSASDRAILEAYLKIDANYNEPVSPELDPTSSSWNTGAYFSSFSIDADWETDSNNTSIVTFFKLGNFTLVYPGDIESRGWEMLLKNKNFVNVLKTTWFFVASHHGREVGFSQEVMKIAQPGLVIISDSWFKDTSVTSRYSNEASGFNVEDNNKQVTEKRKVVSTRNDGRIVIDIYHDGTNASAHVNVKLSS